MGLFDSIGALGSKFGNWVEQVDPLGHAIANRVMYWDSKVTREAGRGIKNTFGENTVLGHIGSVVQNEAQKNVDDPDAGIMKAAAVAAMIYGGGAAMGGEGAAGGGASVGSGAAADSYMMGAAEAGGGAGAAGAGAGAVAGDTYMGSAAEAGAGTGGAAGSGGAGGAGGAAGGAKSGGTLSGGELSGGTSTTGSMAKDVGKALATQTLLQAMQPKAPKGAGPQAMPDPQATAAARKRKLIEQSARRGRVSTILTSNRGDLG